MTPALRPTRRTRSFVHAALALASIVGLGLIATQLSPTATAQASSGLRFQRGYSVQGSWLCYGWSSGQYHCTQHWHRTGGQLISDNPTWVPNTGSAAASTSATAHAAGKGPGGLTHGPVQGSSTAGEPCRSTTYFAGTPSQWQVPPSCYAGIYTVNPRNYVSRPGYGWCNWWPEVMNPSRPDLLWGHYRRGSTPVPGATVVFAPGVQGASSGGHYGRVVAVYPGGHWLLISEMNFTWRGAGFAKVSYRYVHTGPGISFIY
ncbi:MAG: hypothetical protein ACXVCO_12770 [Ktedonobacterales bacterium]